VAHQTVVLASDEKIDRSSSDTTSGVRASTPQTRSEAPSKEKAQVSSLQTVKRAYKRKEFQEKCQIPYSGHGVTDLKSNRNITSCDGQNIVINGKEVFFHLL
jgi:hypothetical protein